jgi:hypothetical protein
MTRFGRIGRSRSPARPSTWLIVTGGPLVYSAVVSLLVATGAWPGPALPWWIAPLAPPVAYGIVVAAWLRPASSLRWTVATVVLGVAHVLLGRLTGLVVARFDPSPVEWGSLVPALAPLLLVAPLVLSLRDVIAQRPRSLRVARARARGRAPMPDGRTAAPIRATPTGASAAPVPSTPPPTARPTVVPSREGGVTESRAQSRQIGAPTLRLDQNGAAGRRVAPKPAVAGPTVKAAVAPPAASRLVEEMLAGETSAAVVRVSFNRVVAQIPAGAFRLPLDRMATSLLEPGYLLIPQRLVLAQLAEGLVRVGWEVVGEQFPRHLLTMTDQEIATQLSDGQLVLPLDELVPQLPRELFAVAGPLVDMEGIASFPAPFQPTMSERLREGRAEVAEDPVAVSMPTEAAEASTTELWEPAAEWSLEQDPESTCEEAGLPTLEHIEPEPDHAREGAPEIETAANALLEIESPLLDPGLVAGAPSEPALLDPKGLFGAPREPTLTWAETVDAGPPSAAVPAPPAATAELVVVPPGVTPDDEAAASRKIAAFLAPYMALDVRVQSMDGVRLFMTSTSALSAESLLGVTRLFVPLLADGRAPWTVDQMTVRGPDIALVLTPLGAVAEGGPVLLSAIRPGATLALLEILSLRVVAEYASTGPRAGAAGGEERQEPDVIDIEPPTRVRQIAASLSAVGTVTAWTLRDVEADRDLYLFLPPDSDARTVGGFASELDAALREAAAVGPALHTAALRCGSRRLIVRLEDATRPHSSILVAGGETARPGLAYRQVESAARRLGAR